MCDCYNEKCKLCSMVFPIHLMDFETDRREIEVYCKKHTPKDRDDGVVWEFRSFKMPNPRKWYIVFIRALTPNASIHVMGNHPNASKVRIVEYFSFSKVKELNRKFRL